MYRSMLKKLKRIALKLLPWVVVGVVGYFFYQTLAANWEQLGDVSLSVDGWIVASIVLFVLAVLVTGTLWGRLLGVLTGKPISPREAVRVQCASWLLKYIPGQAGSYVNKVLWAKKRGISKKTVSTSFIYENVLMVFAGMILSVPIILLFAHRIDDEASLLLPLLALIPMLVVMIRPLFYWLLNTIFARLGKDPFRKEDFLSSKKLFQYQIGYLLPRILNGIAFVFICISLVPIEPSMYLGLIAAYTFASIVGLLAIFVPSGIGVREGVVVLLITAYVPVEQAVVLAIVSRLYVTIADVGVAAVYAALSKGGLRQLWQNQNG